MWRTGSEKVKGNAFQFPKEYVQSSFILNEYLTVTLDERAYEKHETHYIDQIIKFGGVYESGIVLDFTRWSYAMDRDSIFNLFKCLNKIELKVPKDIRKLLFKCLRKLDNFGFGGLESTNKLNMSAAEAA